MIEKIDIIKTIDNYRLSRFVIKIDIQDGWVLYNTMTGSIVAISNEEDLRESLDSLVKMYFYVPQDFDEISFVNQLRVEKSPKLQAGIINGFTILTTTDCNARCFYCYEKGLTRISMTEKTANDVADYIIKTSLQSPIDLRWFGGEPLANTNAIDIICNKLVDNGIKFISTMVSNGLLFTDLNLSKATNLWNLKDVQITLDGTKDVYQKAKSYIHATGNEFDMVINNIFKLIERKISVSIRLNQDIYNTDNLLELVEFLSTRFKNKKLVSVYNSWLYDESLDIEVEIEKARYDKYKLLQDKIIECGLYRKNPLKKKLRLSCCMADNDSSALITPTGKIGKCEHFITQHLVGSIYDNEFDINEITNWKEQYQPTQKCFECPLYPQCIRVKRCPEERERCSFIQHENRIELIKKVMMQKYQSI